MSTRPVFRPLAEPAGVAGVEAFGELVGLAAAVLDVLWIHPFLCILAGPAPDGTARVALWPLVLLAGVARGVVWLLETRGVAGPAYTATVGLAGLGSVAGAIWLAFYAGSPDAGLGGAALARAVSHLSNDGLALAGLLLTGGYVWRQALGGATPGLSRIFARFQAIIATFVVYAVLAQLANAGFLTVPLVRDLFVVFLAALCGLAVARARMEGERSHQLLSGRWLAFTLGMIGAVLALGLLVAGLFSPELSNALFAPLWTAVEWFGALFVGLWLVFAYVVFSILDALFGFLRNLPRQARPTPPPQPNQGDLLRRLRELPPGSAGHGDLTLYAFLGAVALLLILALLARAVLLSARRRRRELGAGERESLFTWGALLQSLQDRAHSAPPPDPLLALARDPAYRYTVRVRRAYRAALARAATAGLARRPAQTADELLPALQEALPAAPAPLATLTGLYDGVRYTAAPATAADAAAAEQALQALGPK